MRRWSLQIIVHPMTKPEVRQLIVLADQQAAVSDVSLVTAVPAQHPARQWLIDNPSAARELKSDVDKKRAEDL
jgi:hypothetical protein